MEGLGVSVAAVECAGAELLVIDVKASEGARHSDATSRRAVL